MFHMISRHEAWRNIQPDQVLPWNDAMIYTAIFDEKRPKLPEIMDERLLTLVRPLLKPGYWIEPVNMNQVAIITHTFRILVSSDVGKRRRTCESAAKTSRLSWEGGSRTKKSWTSLPSFSALMFPSTSFHSSWWLKMSSLWVFAKIHFVLLTLCYFVLLTLL